MTFTLSAIAAAGLFAWAHIALERIVNRMVTTLQNRLDAKDEQIRHLEARLADVEEATHRRG